MCLAAIAALVSPGRSTRTGAPQGTASSGSRGIDIAAIVARAHFAFRDDEVAGAWTGGDRSYRSRVDANGAIAVRPVDGATTGGAIDLTTLAVQRGAHAIARDATVRRDDEGRIAIARGAALVERVSNTARGVEQAWEFASRPAGSGDVVVRVGVTGTRFAGETSRGLHFRDDVSHLGIAYGAATWIDARGVTHDVPMTYAAGAIELRVDAALIDASAYPAVLDPMIGGEVAIDQPITTLAPAYEPTIAFDGTNDLVCWSDSRASTATFCARVAPTTGLVLSDDAFGHLIGPNSGNSTDAKFDGTNYIVTWMKPITNGASVATARVSPATGMAVSGDEGGVILGGTTLEAAPRVATDGTNSLVVWSEGSPALIYGARISGATGRVLADDIGGRQLSAPTPGVANENQEYPTVAFDGSNYAVGWLDLWPDVAMPGYDYVYMDARLISALTANPVAGVVTLFQITGAGIQSPPDLAFDGQSYVFLYFDGAVTSPVAFARRLAPSNLAAIGSAVNLGSVAYTYGLRTLRTAITPTADVFAWYGSNAVTVTTTDRTLATKGTASFPLTNTTNNYYSQVAVTFDGSLVSVVWSDTSSGIRTIQEGQVNPTTGAVTLSGHTIANATNEESNPVVACDPTNCLVLWTDNRGNTSNSYTARVNQATETTVASDVAGQLFQINGAPVVGNVSLAFDGTNYFAAWQTSSAVTGARISPATGQVLPSDASGILLANSYYYGQSSPPAIAVGGGDEFVAWSGVVQNNPVIEFARVDQASGIVLGPGANGNVLANSVGQKTGPVADFDGSDFLTAWADARSGTARIYAGRVNVVTGNVLDGNGIALSTSLFAEQSPSIAFDGTTHLVAWTDSRNDPNHADIYGARVSTSANALNVLSSGHDLPISTATDDQRLPSVVYTGDGLNFAVVWQDFRNGNDDVYSALVGDDGTIRDPDGLAIAASTDAELTPHAAAIGGGGVFAVYQRFDSSSSFEGYRARGRFFSSGLATAGSCTSDLDCATRNCADGVCCNEACDGPCQTCNATPGTCTAVTGKDDPDTCALTCDPSAASCQPQSSCNANGSCTLLNGSFATTAGACLSGFLVEGVCCDTACNEGCGTCTADGNVGKCSPLVKGSNGVNGACVADGGADIYCDGVGVACPNVCTVDAQCPSGYFCGASKKCVPQIGIGAACDPSTDCATSGCTDCTAGTTCAVATCDGDAGTSRVSAASGAGTCVPAVDLQSLSCGGFGCDGTQCKKTCATSADCAANFTCSAMTGACVQSATCVGPHTVEDVGGAKTDCTPYVCTAGACENRCSSINDCVGGYACDQNGTCVASASTTTTTPGPGCSCTLGPRRGSASLFPIGLTFAILLVRRSRKRAAKRAGDVSL